MRLQAVDQNSRGGTADFIESLSSFSRLHRAQRFTPTKNRPLAQFREAAALPIRTRPVLLGPVIERMPCQIVRIAALRMPGRHRHVQNRDVGDPGGEDRRRVVGRRSRED